MSKPKISLENHDELYEYYAKKKLSPTIVRISHFLLSQAFKPRVHYIDDSKEKIKETFARGGQFIMTSNHLSAADQYILGSIVRREEVLRPFMGNTVIPGKAPVFKIPVLRSFVDNLGAVPTFRTKEVLSEENSHLNPDERDKAHSASRQALLDVCIKRVTKDGMSMAIFPEGTRNRENPENLLPLKIGVGIVACEASTEVEDLSILPIGMSYRSSKALDARDPIVCIGEPILGPFNEVDQVLELVDEKLQKCVDAARFIVNHENVYDY